MDERRRTPLWPWIVAGFLAVPMQLALYVASLGPVCWLGDHDLLPSWTGGPIVVYYWPILWTAEYGPKPAQDALDWYASTWGH